MRTVLVLGGTGYLGQAVVQHLAARGYKVGFTHHSTVPPGFDGNTQAFWVDLKTGQGLHDCLDALGQVHAIVNCAAVSSPAACEKDTEHCRAINIPHKLLDALGVYKTVHDQEPLLVHLSTDQVYGGSRAWWKEGDECEPINAYGRSKLDAEVCIQERWPRHVILRSSIIFGPQSKAPVSRLLFLQFIAKALAQGKSATFFEDEYRCPIFVSDLACVIERLVSADSPPLSTLYNVGGRQRLSRLEMAQVVKERQSLLASLQRWELPGTIIAAPGSSVERPVNSPADISMDISRLESELHPQLTAFEDAIDQIGEALRDLDSQPTHSIERLGQ